MPVVNEAFGNTSVIPPRVIADSGYRSEAISSSLRTSASTRTSRSVARARSRQRRASERATAPGRMAAKPRTKRGRRIYKLRKAFDEPVFG